jgi:hypothetical protein
MDFIGYAFAFLLGLAMIPLKDEIVLQLDMRKARKAEAFEAAVQARLHSEELKAWGIITGPQPEDSTPVTTSTPDTEWLDVMGVDGKPSGIKMSKPEKAEDYW